MKMNNMPSTNEQIQYNRNWVAKELNRLSNIASVSNLIYACLIHWAPISKDLESRVAFFEGRYEAQCWLDNIEKNYINTDVPYSTYIGH